MKQRFEREAPSQAKELWSAAFILMGVRYENALVQSLLRGVLNMKESSTYRSILEEGEAIGEARGKAIGKAIGEATGKAEGARRTLLLQGRDRFGEPSAKVLAALESVTDLSQLEALAVRLLHVETWEELLHVNGTTRPARPKIDRFC